MFRAAWIRFAFCLTLILPVAACGDSATGPDNSLAGTYTLQTVDGAPLPFLFFEFEASRYEMTAGRITLKADRTFDESFTYRVTENGQAQSFTEADNGTWVPAGDGVTLRYGPGDQVAATVSGGVMTVNLNGTRFVFQR